MVRDSWMALDFETATRNRNSACALGVAVIEDGEIVAAESWLIQPPGNVYEPMNTRVHGLDEDDTWHAPTFAELYDSIWPYLHERDCLAHSASFDVSVLRALTAHYGLRTPAMRYVCSCALARRAFPRLADHRLPTLCSHCGINLAHHDAASDALACAQVALKCRDQVRATSVHDAVKLLGVGYRAL